MRRIPVEQRREELIAAAIRVVTRGGVGALTTRAVAAEAGMPLGAIHYIFASQDELIRAVTDVIRDEERLAAEVVSLEAQTIEDALCAGLGAYVRLVESDPTKELAVLELALHSRRGDRHDTMRDQWSGYRAAARGLLEQAAVRAGVTWTLDLDDLARMLIVAMDGLTLGYLADGDLDAADRAIAILAAALATHTRPLTAEDVHAH
ncbi:TetR/AcrR family transcriptional regulator [Microbacterium sediminicola]|uniref:TetR/AcrR family transcriptional regulator n=1 Tax=Microbacterium sediminicola TaxID=415210 RepID=A0ABN2HXE2_9MICO